MGKGLRGRLPVKRLGGRKARRARLCSEWRALSSATYSDFKKQFTVVIGSFRYILAIFNIAARGVKCTGKVQYVSTVRSAVGKLRLGDSQCSLALLTLD